MEHRRVAIVGAGISGLAYAHVLRRRGYAPVVFEKGARVGGVWALAYPGVRLQNIGLQYHLSDVPWPEPPDLHPTRDPIQAYWEHVVREGRLDVRLGHEVRAAEERDGGWRVETVAGGEVAEHRFEHLVVAVGQYTEGKHRPRFEGEDDFAGAIGTERDVGALRDFAGQRVVVVGFGKSALDIATFASEHGAEVDHVFRTPRWVLPMHLLGVHSSWFLFTRFGSVLMPGWGHPTALERFIHQRLAAGVQGFWSTLAALIRREITGRASDARGRERLRAVLPEHPFLFDLRSAAALEPPGYFGRVADGRIEPHRAELERFTADGVRLSDGSAIACDRVVLALGSEAPRFPFLPETIRASLEAEPDGVQLYRHLIHPRLPRLGFAGLNHGFMHVPSAEVGAEWLACLWRGELELPPVEEMERSVERIRAWKRANITFEPSRSCAINTRYQQHLDILLQDLGVSPYRKLPNVVAELFARYGASDYAGVGEELRRSTWPRRPLPIDA